MSNIQVYIRTSDDAESEPLCSWPADDLGRLVDIIKEWGVYVDGDVMVSDFSGQFRMGQRGGGYFEIVAHLADD